MRLLGELIDELGLRLVGEHVRGDDARHRLQGHAHQDDDAIPLHRSKYRPKETPF
jgi:hypothetical protein